MSTTVQMEVVATIPDPAAPPWAINDEVLQLREWGTDRIYDLPAAPAAQRLVLGSSADSELRIADPGGRISRHHASLVRDGAHWLIRDLGSKNGLRIDGVQSDNASLEPGVEIGLGGITLLAESQRLIALRRVLSRALGWDGKIEVVDYAIRSVRLAATRNLPLVFSGDADQVATAHAVHRIARGARPFVSCDPRRGVTEDSVRVVQNFKSGMDAFAHADGGSVYVWSHRPPRDFDALRGAVMRPGAGVQLVMMWRAADDDRKSLIAPIAIPPLSARAAELPRIAGEYLHDAAAELGARPDVTDRADRDWLLATAATSLTELEKATLRLVALRMNDNNLFRAAARLGMARISLKRWIEYRKLSLD